MRYSLIILLHNLCSLISTMDLGFNSKNPSSSSGGRTGEATTCCTNAFLRHDTWKILWIVFSELVSQAHMVPPKLSSQSCRDHKALGWVFLYHFSSLYFVYMVEGTRKPIHLPQKSSPHHFYHCTSSAITHWPRELSYDKKLSLWRIMHHTHTMPWMSIHANQHMIGGIITVLL